MMLLFGAITFGLCADEELLLVDRSGGRMLLQKYFSEAFTSDRLDLPEDWKITLIETVPDETQAQLQGNVVYCAESFGKLPDEKVYKVKVYALQPVVLAVPADCGIENITLEDLKKIYNGRIDNWAQLNLPAMSVRMAGTDPESPEGRVFRKLVMQQDLFSSKAPEPGCDILPDMLLCGNDTGASAVVQSIPGSIVFGSPALQKNASGKYKILKVNGIAPSQENILSGKYPLVAAHIIYCRKDRVPACFDAMAKFLQRYAGCSGKFVLPEEK